MRTPIRILLTLVLAIGAVVGGVGTANADPASAAEDYTISGSVYAAPAVAPLDEVEVGLYQSNGMGGWNRINWVVPLNGAYQFSDVPAGAYRIGAEAPAGAGGPKWRYRLPRFVGGASTVESATDIVVAADTIVASIGVLENARVTGTVTSAVDGSALSGAAVTLYWFSGPDPYQADTVVTGPLGEYAVYVPSGEGNSFSLRFAKTGYQPEYAFDKPSFAQAELRAAIPWDNMDAGLRARMTARVGSSVSSFRGSARARITTVLTDGSTGSASANAQFRLQRSYDGRTWTNIGGVLRTGTTGRHVVLTTVSRTTYFRAVPVSSAKYYGVASARVRVRKL